MKTQSISIKALDDFSRRHTQGMAVLNMVRVSLCERDLWEDGSHHFSDSEVSAMTEALWAVEELLELAKDAIDAGRPGSIAEPGMLDVDAR